MNDQQDKTLAPCPFCGGEPECARTLNFPPDDWQWYVRCNCFVAPASWDENREKAVAEWNRRAATSAQEARIARLREALIYAEAYLHWRSDWYGTEFLIGDIGAALKETQPGEQG